MPLVVDTSCSQIYGLPIYLKVLHLSSPYIHITFDRIRIVAWNNTGFVSKICVNIATMQTSAFYLVCIIHIWSWNLSRVSLESLNHRHCILGTCTWTLTLWRRQHESKPRSVGGKFNSHWSHNCTMTSCLTARCQMAQPKLLHHCILPNGK